MPRNAKRTADNRFSGFWGRLIRGLKRLIMVVSVIAVAAMIGLVTQRATDMPVQQIAITGEMQHVPRAVIESVIRPNVIDGFLLTDLTSIAHQLEALPWVFDASVRREWPGTVRVHVIEQTPIARWGVSSYINQHGDVFEGEQFERYGVLPLLWSERSKPSALIEQFKLFQLLLTPHELGVAALNEDRLNQISAQLTDGTEVQFGDKDFAVRVRRFVALLESEGQGSSIARIDFRYERGAAVLRRESQFAVTKVAQAQGVR